MEQMTHHRAVVSRRGGPDVIEVVEEPRPNPGPGEARVRVLAAGVSAYDIMLRSHWFPGFPQVPFTPGVDVVGVVDEGTSGIAPGQRVAAGPLLAGGGYAEFVCLPAAQWVPVPAGVDPAEAACVVVNYLTAYLMLHRTAGVQRGERILVHGAAGGVGTALLDLGRLAELEMYGTASKNNHEQVAAFGATPIDYRAEDFVERIRSLTGDGVDAVFDPIGGARQLWRSYRVLRKGGRLVWFGVAATSRTGMRVIPVSLVTRLGLALLPDGKRAPMPPTADDAWYRTTLAMLLEWLSEGRLAPVVAARVPLAKAALAHEQLERGGHAGKIVLVTPSYSSVQRQAASTRKDQGDAELGDKASTR